MLSNSKNAAMFLVRPSQSLSPSSHTTEYRVQCFMSIAYGVFSRERSTTCSGKCLSQYRQLWQVPLDPDFKLAFIPLLPFLSQPSLLT